MEFLTVEVYFFNILFYHMDQLLNLSEIHTSFMRKLREHIWRVFVGDF